MTGYLYLSLSIVRSISFPYQFHGMLALVTLLYFWVSSELRFLSLGRRLIYAFLWLFEFSFYTLCVPDRLGPSYDSVPGDSVRLMIPSLGIPSNLRSPLVLEFYSYAVAVPDHFLVTTIPS